MLNKLPRRLQERQATLEEIKRLEARLYELNVSIDDILTEMVEGRATGRTYFVMIGSNLHRFQCGHSGWEYDGLQSYNLADADHKS